MSFGEDVAGTYYDGPHGDEDAVWARGRGWTLWRALITLAEQIDTGSPQAEESRRVIDEVLADHDRVS